MSQLINLPTIENKNVIVVDEGVNVTYSKYLIIAWLQAIRKKGINNFINILLFSQPKKHLDKFLRSLKLTNYEIQDYFNIYNQKDQINVYEQLIHCMKQHADSIFVVDCLNTLILEVGLAKGCRFIERLSLNNKFQVFYIYRRDIYQNIPRIETLGNIYVKLKKSKKIPLQSNIYYEVSIIQKKISGSVIRWTEFVQQNVENCTLESEKILDNTDTKTVITKQPGLIVKPESSFRLEMNEQEIKQRDSTPLPYILPDNPGGESEIIYVPDDVDDFDDEDPDDDLDI